MKYRTKLAYTKGYKDAAIVMAYETFDMANTSILHTLRKTILKDNKFTELLKTMDDLIHQNNGYHALVYMNSNYKPITGVEFFKEILEEINHITGKNIKYVLWLCDTKEDIRNMYGESFTDDKIDTYQESDIIFADLSSVGKLYGYEICPKPITETPEPVSYAVTITQTVRKTVIVTPEPNEDPVELAKMARANDEIYFEYEDSCEETAELCTLYPNGIITPNNPHYKLYPHILPKQYE